MKRNEVTKQFCKLLTLAGILASGNVNAFCLLEGIDIWPPPGDIPPNMVVLVAEYGGRLTTGIESCEFRLVSDTSDVVCLDVKETNRGYMKHQFLLKPAKLLTHGKSYSLRMDPESPRILDWREQQQRGSRESKGARWFVNLPKDESWPQWNGSPQVSKAIIEEYGCGLAINAFIDLPQLDPNTLVRTDIRREPAVQWDTYLIAPSYDGTLYVGHGMCSGAFALKPGESYLGRLELVDVAGNVSATLEEVRFKIPNRER